MKKVLITGANGFIGKNVLESLSAKYDFIPASRSNNINICDLESLKSLACSDIDTILHLGALVHPILSKNQKYEFFSFNINSTLNIAEFAREMGVKHIIYLNTYVYGKPNYLPIDEDHKIELITPYHQSKYLAEQMLFEYFKADLMTKITSLRLFNLFGRHQSTEFIIAKILDNIRQCSSVEVQDIGPRRDYLYIKDLVSLLDNIIAFGSSENNIYNVGLGESHSVDDIIDAFTEKIGTEIKVINRGIRRENEIMDCVANIRKVSKDYKWQPKYSFKVALRELMDINFNE